MQKVTYLEKGDVVFFKLCLLDRINRLDSDLALDLSPDGAEAVRDHRRYLLIRLERVQATLDAIESGELVLTLPPPEPVEA